MTRNKRVIWYEWALLFFDDLLKVLKSAAKNLAVDWLMSWFLSKLLLFSS